LQRALDEWSIEDVPLDLTGLWPLGLEMPMPGRSSKEGESLFVGDPLGQRDLVLPCGLRQAEALDMMTRELTPEDFEALSKLDESLPKRDTVEQTAVDSLQRRLGRDCTEADCGVCLLPLDPAKEAACLPCKHAFHPACIGKWLTQCKNTCPLCSTPIDLKDSQELPVPDAPTPPTQGQRRAKRRLSPLQEPHWRARKARTVQ